ncbi:MAG: PilN domain-containing protein [bacterium]
MQLPMFVGHKKAINLLPRDSFESSTLGIVLEWALTFGKWAVILTQLVVIVVFLWRFTLDRKLTDLRKQITQEIMTIESYGDLEENFLIAQKMINFAKPVLATQNEVQYLLKTIQSLTPIDVWYEKIIISTDSINFTAYSASLPGFGRLLSALQRESKFTNINIGNIENGGEDGALLRFDMTLSYGDQKK